MSSESEITYAQILKIIATPKATAKTMSDKIVGKSISLKLIATGPQALMVNREDLIFFICNSKAPGFKAGNVKTKITKFFSPAYGEEGEITITLAECKN